MQNFLDFRGKRLYLSFTEKLIDFIVGGSIVFALGYVLVYPISSFLFSRTHIIWVGPLLIFAIVLYMLAIFYFWKRRKYLALGIFFAAVIPILLGIVGVPYFNLIILNIFVGPLLVGP